MECAVIVTYRCNARCQMCNTWQHPSRKSEEISPEVMDRIPGGMKRINLTGGEPMLRDDIMEIVEVLDKKTDRLEISTNGYFTDRIVKVCERFPHITIRVSIDGLPKLHDQNRGLRDGFDHALRTLLQLKQMRVKDIGLGIVISHTNVYDLLDLYTLASSMGIEFTQCVMHNSFYFHKQDNRTENLPFVLDRMHGLIRALLRSNRSNLHLRVKDWFRAYINLGLTRYIQGQMRPLPCGAATDLFFLDPYGKVLACNGSAEPWVMGDLVAQPFEEIWNSPQAAAVRRQVAECDRNCWMVGSAVPAMRKRVWVPVLWVLKNKIRLLRGKDIVYDS